MIKSQKGNNYRSILAKLSSLQELDPMYIIVLGGKFLIFCFDILRLHIICVDWTENGIFTGKSFDCNVK